MNIYDLIFEELQNRVDSGELTLEQANEVNDLAYNKYVTEGFTDILPFILIGAATAGIAVCNIYDNKMHKKAMKIYEDNNPDIPKFKDLKRKIYKKIGYSNLKGKEITNKISQDFANSTIEEYSLNGKVVFVVIYDLDDIGDSFRETMRVTFIDDSIKKHTDYYLTGALLNKKLSTRKLNEWCHKIIKDNKEK